MAESSVQNLFDVNIATQRIAARYTVWVVKLQIVWQVLNRDFTLYSKADADSGGLSLEEALHFIAPVLFVAR